MPFTPPDWMRVEIGSGEPAAPEAPPAPVRSRTKEPGGSISSAPTEPKPAGLHRAKVWDSSADGFVYPEQAAGIVARHAEERAG